MLHRHHFTTEKYQSLGNVFLICLVDDESDSDRAVNHFQKLRTKSEHGWGEDVDGLIIAWHTDEVPETRPGWRPAGAAAVRMLLFNADGGRAETSGNGLCCLGQAVARQTRHTSLTLFVHTDAGDRHVHAYEGDHHRGLVTTSMGTPLMMRFQLGDLAAEVLGRHSEQIAYVNAGNPHVVMLVDDLEQVDIAQVGAEVRDHFSDVNVECFTVSPDRTTVALKVWERGVGVTQACGTGAVAVVAMCREWKLVDAEHVAVFMPGGKATVSLEEPMRFTTHVELMDDQPEL